MKKILILAGCAFITVAQLSCSSSTEVVSSWKAQDVMNLQDKKVLVMGISDGEQLNTTAQLNMEQELANNLKSRGIDAEAASSAFSPKTFSNMKENEALNALKTNGYDAVMTIVLLDKSKEQYYQPGTARYYPVGPYYNSFWGYYSWMYGRVYEPGYYTTSTNYFWESNLYNLNNDRLLYSVQSESFDPASYQQLSEEYARNVVSDMSKQGLVAKM